MTVDAAQLAKLEGGPDDYFIMTSHRHMDREDVETIRDQWWHMHAKRNRPPPMLIILQPGTTIERIAFRRLMTALDIGLKESET